MLNKATNDFIDALTKLVNNSGLPPVNVRLALDTVRAGVFEIERKTVQAEIQKDAEEKAKQKEEAKKKEEEEKKKKAKKEECTIEEG